jgi:CBS domain-containing protein
VAAGAPARRRRAGARDTRGPAARAVREGCEQTVQNLLDEREITVYTERYASAASIGELRFFPEGAVPADRVVALPRLQGRRIGDIPQTIDGFIPVDEHGRVDETDDVFAAGDVTNFSVKQGGIAAQQALAAAETIPAQAGADIEPRPFHPVLRGMLLTGEQPRYLRRDIVADGETSWASEAPIWWPPAKIVGRHLAPFLATLAGVEHPSNAPVVDGAVHVEVELAEQGVERLSDRRLVPSAEAPEPDETATTVGDVMSGDPLIVAPEDTIGEVAERMRQLNVGSALVTQFGRLIGVLTTRDLLRALASRVHSSDARARQWMTAEPIVVSRDTPTRTAGALMTEYGIHHLPVVDGDRPIGLIGSRDVSGPATVAPPRPVTVHGS